MPLVEINNREELEAWLRKEPREVAAALAARAALRVLPLLQTTKFDELRDISLPVFRALAVSWAVARYPARGTELAARGGYMAAAQFMAFGPTDVTALVANAAARTAAAAVTPDALTAAARAAAYAADAIFAAADDGAAAAAFWSAVSIDATRVEDRWSVSDIAGSPLWPQGQPERLQSLWLEMKTMLLAERQDWPVWIHWYDLRLSGRVRDEAVELAYVSIGDDLWNQGPAVVNAEIKWRIAALESKSPPIDAIPEQETLATRFGVNAQGLIDVVPDPPEPGAAADLLQREYYGETRLKAEALVALGSNQLGELSGPANRFREGLKDRIEDISITSLWSRGNTLRIRLKAHDLSMNSVEPDAARLPPLVAETLRDLVHTWNIFIGGDAKGRELDEIRLGPQDVEAAKQVNAAARPVIVALQQSESVVTPEAIETIAEQAETAKNAPAGIDGEQAADLSRKTTGNFVSELLRRAYSLCLGEGRVAWKESRAGFYQAAGAATFTVTGPVGYAVYNNWPAIVSFVARNAEALKDLVIAAWHNPTLVEIVDLGVRSLP